MLKPTQMFDQVLYHLCPDSVGRVREAHVQINSLDFSLV